MRSGYSWQKENTAASDCETNEDFNSDLCLEAAETTGAELNESRDQSWMVSTDWSHDSVLLWGQIERKTNDVPPTNPRFT